MSTVKVWNGTSWVDKTTGIKRWTGSAWVTDTFKYWTGSAWVEINPVTGINHVGTTTAGSSVASLPIAWPGHANNDVAYLFWTMSNTSTPTAAPTGFTQIAQTDGPGATNPRTYLYRKVCDGTESGNLSLDLSTGVTRQSAVLAVYRGVNTTTPEDVAIAVDNSHAQQQTHNAPSITNATQDAVVVIAIHERVTTVDTAFTPPAGYTERGDTLTLATGTGGSITAVADNLTPLAPSTVVTPGDWTGNDATGTANIITYTLALRPV